MRRELSDEAYVIDLCDEVLGERASRQHRFPWLVGDPGKDGLCRTLPVDAFYAGHQVVVEYRERQHSEPVPFWDRRKTVSGISRGEQRTIYDERRGTEIPKRRLRLVIITPGDLTSDSRGKLRRHRAADLEAIVRLLARVVVRKGQVSG